MTTQTKLAPYLRLLNALPAATELAVEVHHALRLEHAASAKLLGITRAAFTTLLDDTKARALEIVGACDVGLLREAAMRRVAARSNAYRSDLTRRRVAALFVELASQQDPQQTLPMPLEIPLHWATKVAEMAALCAGDCLPGRRAVYTTLRNFEAAGLLRRVRDAVVLLDVPALAIIGAEPLERPSLVVLRGEVMA